jgi:hypothetical protein
MLGPAKPRRLDQPVAVSLEALVPQDHFYRHLEATLDLGFVREWARELYADRGRPSIDVEANADFDSLVPRFTYEAKRHLEDLFADEAPPNDPLAAEPPTGIVQLPTAPNANGMSPPDEGAWRLLEERRLDAHRPSDRDYARMSEWRVSTADPDATSMRTDARTTSPAMPSTARPRTSSPSRTPALGPTSPGPISITGPRSSGEMPSPAIPR